MKGWLISVVGIILIGVLIDIILPEGETNKYIKGIFALIVTIIIISPLPAISKHNWSFGINLMDDSISYDQEFTQYFSEQRLESDKRHIKSIVELYDYKDSTIELITNNNSNYKIIKIKVNIPNLTQIDKNNIYKQIKSNFPNSEVIIDATQ